MECGNVCKRVKGKGCASEVIIAVVVTVLAKCIPDQRDEFILLTMPLVASETSELQRGNYLWNLLIVFLKFNCLLQS